MPGRTLPNIPAAEVQKHNTEKSCYVTVGTKVYDITSFLDDHPGGGDLILEYGGKDVEHILKDEVSHEHSEAAYEILDESLVGFMPTEPVMNGVTKSSKPAEIVPLMPTKTGEKELLAVGEKPLYENTGMSVDSQKTSISSRCTDRDTTEEEIRHRFLATFLSR
jgi:4-hydroxysphinganine ceramide fatty acyl 2-hydroxylase